MNRVAPLVVIVSVIGGAPVPGPAPAAAQQPASAGTSAPGSNLYARIPAEIGAFRLAERTAVRGLPTDSLFRFRDGSQTILSVIVYDVAADVRVDADSQKWTAREGEKFKAVQDVRASRGQIAAYEVAFSDTTRFAAGDRTILEHSIAAPVRFPNGAIAVELQYLYLIDGKFVKVRATVPEKGWEETQVPGFARELALRMARRT